MTFKSLRLRILAMSELIGVNPMGFYEEELRRNPQEYIKAKGPMPRLSEGVRTGFAIRLITFDGVKLESWEEGQAQLLEFLIAMDYASITEILLEARSKSNELGFDREFLKKMKKKKLKIAAAAKITFDEGAEVPSFELTFPRFNGEQFNDPDLDKDLVDLATQLSLSYGVNYAVYLLTKVPRGAVIYV